VFFRKGNSLNSSQDILVRTDQDELIEIPVIENELIRPVQDVPLDFKISLDLDLDIDIEATHSKQFSPSKLSFPRQKTLVLSLLVHLIVLAILMLGSNIHQSNIIEKLAVQTEPKPLKSFLYYAPKASTKPIIKPVENENLKTKVITKKTPKNEVKLVAETTFEKDIKNETRVANRVVSSLEKTKNQASENESVKKIKLDKNTHNKELLEFISQSNPRQDPISQDKRPQESLPLGNSNDVITLKSSMELLSDLRKRINNQAMQALIDEQQQHRPRSAMLAQEIPVPHSKNQLTAIDKKVKNTMKMSDGISITRLGNGYCIIERGQALGSPIPASRSGFACGESDFDKSFRENMKKVSKKLTPSSKNVN
jgi:hypothetical protein